MALVYATRETEVPVERRIPAPESRRTRRRRRKNKPVEARWQTVTVMEPTTEIDMLWTQQDCAVIKPPLCEISLDGNVLN